MPFFLDGTAPISGAISSIGRQRWLCRPHRRQRPGLLADPSRLVVYQT